MDKINLVEKLGLISEYWHPKIVGEINDSFVMLVKLKGEFIWHLHESEDEMFLVLKGRLRIKPRRGDVILRDGEFFIVPKGVEHMPVADEEVHALLLETKTILNTGNFTNEKTVEAEWL